MPLIINTNVSSLNAQRALSRNTTALGKSLEKLSSGFRINRAGDDAAGLQISEILRGQIRGSQKALENTQSGLSVLQIADGSLEMITENLQRIRELTVQGANDTNDVAQRTAIAQEINARRSDIDRIANASQFNNKVLLDGSQSAANTFVLQVGPNDAAGADEIDISTAFDDAQSANLGIAAAVAFANNAAGQAYLTTVDTALDAVNTQRATIGSFMNRLESAASNLQNSIENLSSAESTIRNTDVAMESANMTRNQILQQASTTILAQANQSPQLALKLLQ
jgi:flagellin